MIKRVTAVSSSCSGSRRSYRSGISSVSRSGVGRAIVGVVRGQELQSVSCSDKSGRSRGSNERIKHNCLLISRGLRLLIILIR